MRLRAPTARTETRSRDQRSREGAQELDTHAAAATDVDMEMLYLFAAVRPGNFQSELIAATEIERRAIECDQSRCLGGEALLEVRGPECSALDGNGAVRGLRGKADCRQRTGGTIGANLSVDADPKVPSRRCFKFPLGDISLRLRGDRRQTGEDGEREPEPARCAASDALRVHGRHPCLLRPIGPDSQGWRRGRDSNP
jgi:hypothetical protein